MATSNVLVTRTGTNWTVDVTACDLDPNLTLKDFITLIAGSVVPNSSFNKTTQTTLTYVGASLPSNTQVEIRRKTPNVVKSPALLGSRVRSSDWNSEFDRVHRHFEEYDLNGAGSTAQVALPKDDPFGVIWDGDTVYPPTRNAIYDYVVTLAPLASPSFTGNPTVPTQLTTDNSTRIASTAYVKNNLTAYATLASPNFTGTPTVPTPGGSDNSTTIANTSWVRTYVTSLNYATVASLSAYAPLVSPAFTGTPSAPTPASLNLTGTQVANQNYVHVANRPFFDVQRATTQQSIPHATATTIIYNSETSDLSGVYNNTTGVFTVPAGLGGYYSLSGFIVLDALVNSLVAEVYVNGSTYRRIGQTQSSTDEFQVLSLNGVIALSPGDSVTVRLTQTNSGTAARNLLVSPAGLNWLTMYRLNV